jgi:tetratricopeptide (TPR) repeat protein
MPPESASLPEPTLPPARPSERPRWLGLMLLSVLLLVVLGLGGRPAFITLRTEYGLYRARQCLSYLEEKQWLDAMRAIADAKRYGRDHPEILRATLTYVTKTNHDPHATIFIINQLAKLGLTTCADSLLLGQSHLALSQVTEARAIYASLSPEEQDSKEGLELLAQLYRNEGSPKEAEAALRRAMAKAPDDPESRLRIALLDHGNPFPEIQARARQTLWELTQVEGRTALIAIRFLAQDQNLTAPEAERLLPLITAHPESSAKDRLDVLSGIIKLIPQRREEILTTEIARVEGKNVEDLIQVIGWLAKEKQYTRILQLVPMKQALQSPQVFPYVAQALGEEGRWADLRRLILSGERLPVPKARSQVWLAEALTHLDKENLSAPRQYLEEAVQASIKTDDGVTLAAASLVSERLGHYDLATRCYQQLALINPKFEVEMLDKVYEMALRQRDTPLMLKTSQQLNEKRPTHGHFRDRLRYLKLLTGIELEQVDAILTHAPPESAVEGATARVPTAFLRALAAWRLKDHARLKSELSQLTDRQDQLNLGQRAVLASLLHHVGQPIAAYRLAETIPTTILLAEEQTLFAILDLTPATPIRPGR